MYLKVTCNKFCLVSDLDKNCDQFLILITLKWDSLAK